MSNDEDWAPIPGFKNYEINKDGDVRNQDKVVQKWGPTMLKYGNVGHPLRLAMEHAMKNAFGKKDR